MGPNVKFVSAIRDAFSNKKNGGQFFSVKKTKPGGGGWSEGGLVKDHTFPLFLTPSLISLIVVSFFLADGSLLGPFS